MSHTRRNFLRNSVLAGGAAIVGAKSSLGQEASQQIKLLVQVNLQKQNLK
ncbi:MAG: twin-arginine translocation signal domain-containing protein [Blastocatellia bacterium]|nr:twin-arginine translocation signal domain-containing protein [Blastocatellia bacterium]